MGKQIIIEYNEYLTLEEKKKQLEKLTEDIRSCFNIEVEPMQIDINKLKDLAKNYLPFTVEKEDIFIDV